MFYNHRFKTIFNILKNTQDAADVSCEYTSAKILSLFLKIYEANN